MLNVIGIDPGQKGGFAVTHDGRDIVELTVMPESTKDLVIYFSKFDTKTTIVYLEKCQPMPKQGVSSVFTYGVHFGFLRGMLEALRLPYWLVPPRRWQYDAFVGTTASEPKKRAKEAACRLFPRTCFRATERSQKAHEGLVDATLIAWWGYRHAKLEGQLLA